MKKDILEHIIKNVLLERVRKAVAVSATKKEEEQAKAGGAIKWASVKIKGKGSFDEISTQVFAAISATPELGVRSKYSYAISPDYYAYVYATPLINVRKQRIPVWVYKFNKPFETQGSLSDTEMEIYTGIFNIGETPMISKKTFEALLKMQDVYQQQEKIRLQQLQSQEETEEDKKINTDNSAAAKRQEWLDQNDTENVTFPYEWYTFLNTGTPINYTVYKETILDNVPYLYFYDKQEDLFFVMKRIDQFLPTIIKEQLNPNFVSYTWQKLWDQIDISTVTPDEKSKLEAIYLKEK